MPKSYKINQDGKQYTFTPGQDGSLIAPDTRQSFFKGFNPGPYVPRAKTVPSPMVDQIKKNRMGILKSMTGASRG